MIRWSSYAKILSLTDWASIEFTKRTQIELIRLSHYEHAFDERRYPSNFIEKASIRSHRCTTYPGTHTIHSERLNVSLCLLFVVAILLEGNLFELGIGEIFRMPIKRASPLKNVALFEGCWRSGGMSNLQNSTNCDSYGKHSQCGNGFSRTITLCISRRAWFTSVTHWLFLFQKSIRRRPARNVLLSLYSTFEGDGSQL
jgi:hypothetical protein